MVGRDPKTQENSKQNTNYKDNIVNHSRNFSNFFRSQSTILQSNDEIYVSDGQQNKELKQSPNHQDCFEINYEKINYNSFQKLIKPKLTREIYLDKIVAREKDTKQNESKNKFTFVPMNDYDPNYDFVKRSSLGFKMPRNLIGDVEGVVEKQTGLKKHNMDTDNAMRFLSRR